MRKVIRRDKWGRFAPKRGRRPKPPRPSIRDKWGRFAPNAGKQLKPLILRKRNVKGQFAQEPQKAKRRRIKWKVIQKGKPIEVEAKGYYIVIRALVPGGWNTDSTPAFLTAAPEESLNLIIWRTRVREIHYEIVEMEEIRNLLIESQSLATLQLALAEDRQQEIIVLSSELRCIVAPHESFQVAVWSGITPPKRFRNMG